jgi:Family of unknown function (DUF6114)
MASDQNEPEFLRMFKPPGEGRAGDGEPGDDQAGGDEPGGDEPGGDEPGGDEPGDDQADGAPARARAAGGAWQAWRRWRHARPFAGGVLVVLAGAEILLTEKGPLPLIVHIGVQGVAGYLIPVVLLLCGLLLLFHPVQRTFYSVLAVLLALGSWITSNLGGFFIGMLLGLVGGWLAFAWRSPEEREAREREAREREARERPRGPQLGRSA